MKTMICASHGCGHRHVYEQSCMQRTCPTCSLKIAKKYTFKYMGLVREYLKWSTMDVRVYFLTLTLKNRNYLDFKELRHYFTLFRRRLGHKFHSGLYCLETTNKDNGWHTHLHAIIVSDNMSKTSISKTWLSVTGDSYIVDFSEAQSIYQCKKYLVSYLSKKSSFDTQEKSEIYRDAIHKTRIIQTFGNTYAWFMDNNYKFACPECGGKFWFYSREIEFYEATCDPCQSYIELGGVPPPTNQTTLMGVIE